MNALDINTSRAVDGYAGGTYNPSAGLVWNHTLVVDASGVTGTNVSAFSATAKGAGIAICGLGSGRTAPLQEGQGVVGLGCSAGGVGVYGQGGSSGTGGDGIIGVATLNGYGVHGESNATDMAGVYGKSSANGIGVIGVGGGGTLAASVSRQGGYFQGGLTTTSGGLGVYATGGTPSSTGSGGTGGQFAGADGATAAGGIGALTQGGDGASNGAGGAGCYSEAGDGAGSGAGGNAIHALAGDGGATGGGGIGVYGAGGAGGGTSGIGGYGAYFEGGNSSGADAGGKGIYAVGGNSVSGSDGTGGHFKGGGTDGIGAYCERSTNGSPLKISTGADPTTQLAIGCISMDAAGIMRSYFGSAWRYVGCQAWANVATDGASGISYHGEIGFSTVTLASSTVARLTFDTALSDAHYCAIPAHLGNNREARIYSQTTTYVEIQILDNAGSSIDLSATALEFNVAIFGK